MTGASPHDPPMAPANNPRALRNGKFGVHDTRTARNEPPGGGSSGIAALPTCSWRKWCDRKSGTLPPPMPMHTVRPLAKPSGACRAVHRCRPATPITDAAVERTRSSETRRGLAPTQSETQKLELPGKRAGQGASYLAPGAAMTGLIEQCLDLLAAPKHTCCRNGLCVLECQAPRVCSHSSAAGKDGGALICVNAVHQAQNQ